MAACSVCGALWFLNLRGDILLERIYRDDIGGSLAEHFRTHVLNARGAATNPAPVRMFGSVTFMYVRHNDLYLLAATRNNANAMAALKFLTSLTDLLRAYYEGDVTAKSLSRNLVLTVEVLEEVMDYGVPQVTDPTALRSLITQKGVKSEGDALRQAMAASSATLQVTGGVGWRREGIKYKKNEVWLDVVEQLSMLCGSDGSILRCEVLGRLLMRCQLSDMPELRLGLNDELEDVTFHSCVNLSTYQTQKVVTFTPPDGEFEVMRYRSQDGITLPFKVTPALKDLGSNRLEWAVVVRSGFNAKLIATDVIVVIPVPEYTSKANILVTKGKAKYDAARKALIWKTKRFPGECEHSLRAEVSLVATTRQRKPWARPPINMTFQVPMFSASALRVTYLKILERKMGDAYQSEKWVRKVCRSGDFQVRV